MTEDEAKKKWCPMVRTGMVAGMAVNHHVDMQPGGDGVYHQSRCIASDCMMWRFTSTGFCGIAGSPVVMNQAIAAQKIEKVKAA